MTLKSEWVTTSEMSARYRVEATTVASWPYMKNFPEHARRRASAGSPVLWNVAEVETWLRSRLRGTLSKRPQRWRGLLDGQIASRGGRR